MFRFIRFLLWALLIVCLMLAIGAGSRPIYTGSASPEAPDSAAFMTTLEEISEFQTLRVGISGIVTAEEKPSWIWQSDSKIVLLVKGYATYGVDLDQVSVAMDAQRLVVTLPRPRVTACWVDVVESSVWDRHEGLLHDASSDLDARAYAAGLALVRREAQREDVVKTARLRAEVIIRELADRPVEVIWM